MLLRTLLWRATGALLLAVAFFACEGGPANPFSNPPIESGLPPTFAEPGLPVAFSHDSNPVREGDFADPFVLVTDSLYYAYATNVGTVNVPTLASHDLVSWSPVGDALPTMGKWAVGGRHKTWAPAVLASTGKYLLFYTARDRVHDRQCIGQAESPNPAGPFIDRHSAPFLCQLGLGGSIDPSVVQDSLGRVYLLWKNDGNCCGQPVMLWSQQLVPGGAALEGQPTAVLRPDQPWEGPLIEAPTMWYQDGSWHLLYSANQWNTDHYAIGYAECETPSGPCRKLGQGPVMASDRETAGPGGAEVFRDHEGRRWVAYHGWTAPWIGYTQGGVRSFRLDRIELVENPVAAR
jgi:beta-xylosidase